jgi:hypothetical protein
LYQFKNDPSQKHNYSNGINNMHYPKVNACWPIGIFFSKEIHNTKLVKIPFVMLNDREASIYRYA